MDIVVIDRLTAHQRFIIRDNEKKMFVLFLVADEDMSGDIEIEIAGSGASVQIVGAVIGGGNHTIRLNTIQQHTKPGSTSDLLINSVLFGKTRLQYDGKIIIDPGAQQSNAYQKNQNLLLSSHAWADSRPTLEILANDVRCTHGATVGTIDEEQVYYLASRGIDREAAVKLLVDGFFAAVWNRIADRDIQERLQKKAEEIYITYLQESK